MSSTSRAFLRNAEADSLFQNFLVSAAASILGVRAFLHLANYPQIAIRGLHIAHILWGGLLMLAAFILFLAYLNGRPRRVAAVVGGLGFGMFLDELGKFVTRDNNYFFQPAVAIIYVVLILVYLIWRSVEKKQEAYTEEERLANVMEIVTEAIANDMDSEERERALTHLKACDPKDPVTLALRELILKLSVVPQKEPGAIARARSWLSLKYHSLARTRWFTRAVVAFFISNAIVTLLQSVTVVRDVGDIIIATLAGALVLLTLFHAQGNGISKARAGVYGVLLAGVLIFFPQPFLDISFYDLSLMQWGELLFSLVPVGLTLVGIYHLLRSRLKAYRSFEHATLIHIFLTQFFAFYRIQFFALWGFALNILILFGIRYLLHQEQAAQSKPAAEEN